MERHAEASICLTCACFQGDQAINCKIAQKATLDASPFGTKTAITGCLGYVEAK